MFVACPACKSVYAIQPAHLRAGGGELRCGACGTRFNATAAVFEDAEQALDHAEQQQDITHDVDDVVGRALGQVPDPGNTGHLTTAPAGDAVQAALEPSGEGSDTAVEYIDRFDVPAEAAETAESSGIEADSFPFDLDGFYEPSEEPLTGGLPESIQEIIIEDLDSFRGLDESAPPAHPEAEGRAVPVPGTARESAVDITFLQSDRDCYAQPAAVEFGSRKTPSGDTGVYQPAPYLLDDPAVSGPAFSWAAITAGLLLLALLAGQFAWHQRYRLAEISELRPAMEQFCALLQCDLPLRREPVLVDMIEREVRDHPAVRGALLINATFINRADFRQTYPVFQISFSDVSGTLVAIRRFSPHEYLLEERPVEQGMQAGEQAYLSLEVLDPGTQAVSFQFEFF